jgi:sec-independent protein translocase protein TatB
VGESVPLISNPGKYAGKYAGKHAGNYADEHAARYAARYAGRCAFRPCPPGARTDYSRAGAAPRRWRECPLETSVFDLSPWKLLVLAVIALVVFGPHELPKMAAKAGTALRELRRIADGAKADLREGLGPEFAEFDLDDLNPRRFVQKHLLSDLNGDVNGRGGSEAATSHPPKAGALLPGEEPPFDSEAT